jgi:CubicO group peptidase (beta-lactamase class C family)
MLFVSRLAMLATVGTALVAQPVPLTAPDVEALLDGLIPVEMARENIAGVVVAVVKDGKVLFSKGYGYADAAAKAPVKPESTLFRPGSISKLFVWTAVMQLVEQGKLDLDADVNQHLDFRIPDAFGKPITLRHIMTHTPGFEETVQNLFSPQPMRLDEYLKNHLPRRVFPPGTVPAYSNYATAVAAYVVQRVSGRPFEQYAEDEIFRRLGMTRTTFRQPLPRELEPHLSAGYLEATAGKKPFEVVGAFPAGSLSGPALDMARFMLAHLQEGEYEGARILKPETVQMMQARQFGLHPAVRGLALGFYEQSQRGLRIIGHGGDTLYFHSNLHMIPEAKLGFFLSQNSAGKGEVSLRSVVWDRFLERYFPPGPPLPPTVASPATEAAAVTGYYEPSRSSFHSVLSVMNAFGQLQVMANADHTISLSSMKRLDGSLDKSGRRARGNSSTRARATASRSCAIAKAATCWRCPCR